MPSVPTTPVVRDASIEGQVDAAVTLAERLLTASIAGATRREATQLRRLGRMLDTEGGRNLIQMLTDQVLRIPSSTRAARRFADAVPTDGVPGALGRLDSMALRAGARVAPLAPRALMPLVRARILRETRGVVLSSEDPSLADHIRDRLHAGVRLNVNLLGEAILSDAEADARLSAVRATLARNDVDYVSVKISAICANLDPLAFEDGVERVSDRLRLLYRDARSFEPAKFVNLDMEEFKDLELTIAAFTRVLDEPEFQDLDAGIVLQAYLPDSHEALERLGAWASARHTVAGAQVKVRLVKGANLAMEQADAELHGWCQAPYGSKADVDASYKALLRSALRSAWSNSIRVGLASHNLFDVAWGLIQRDELADPRQLEIEMLEGMAPAHARAVAQAAHGVLLYAPIVEPADVNSSIAYLSRRLDENTSPENFLRALFTLRPNTPEFAEQARRFRQSVADSEHVATQSRRSLPRPAATVDERGFENEPDADFSVEQSRRDLDAATVSLSDPPHTATTDAVDAIVAAATAAGLEWSTSELSTRRRLLEAAASTLADHRYETLKVMAGEAGKTIREGDPEVSEAIDFARYYATVGLEPLAELQGDGLSVTSRGVVLVAAPWNFPFAIPAGGAFGALAAGNAVILKPAPETRRVAWLLANQLWEAGIPRDLVQYVACDDDEVGRHLVTHDGIDTVILTGSFETAELFTDWRPELRLLAETSGKNALVITQTADLDLALKDLVHSAFGHAGQKCSAASLAIVEAPIYDDPAFRRRLRDAVESYTVGWPADADTIVGPLIGPPSGNLLRALTTLDAGEQWLVRPSPVGSDPSRLWTPGVRLDVAEGSWFHTTECFGPVLGVMRADDLDHAIRLQNGTPFGLTGGIHSLDPDEIRQWLDGVEIGNAYINRHITGAVVQRQPFGGWKRSSVGAGSKAGGPHYVLGLTTIEDPRQVDAPSAAASFDTWWDTFFSRNHDPSGLRSERNVLSHQPRRGVVLRIDDTTDPSHITAAQAAAARCRVALHISDQRAESEPDLLDRLVDLDVDTVRALTPLDPATRRALLRVGVDVDDAPVTGHGRAELVHWLREQAISETTHRHGRLTESAFDAAGSATRRYTDIGGNAR